jgi:hypothetical protein
MSEERINLELLGARVLTLTAEARDLQHRFTAMESRFSALEGRFTAMEARLSGIEGRLGVPGGPHVVDAVTDRTHCRAARRGKSMIHEGSPSAFAAATSG